MTKSDEWDRPIIIPDNATLKDIIDFLNWVEYEIDVIRGDKKMIKRFKSWIQAK